VSGICPLYQPLFLSILSGDLQKEINDAQRPILPNSFFFPIRDLKNNRVRV
jgi:hypothetical protein